MAHFAQLDENNNVIQVIVINNEIITNAKGKEEELLGINFCQSLFGNKTKWVQTSYSGKFRGQFAALGLRYDAVTDTFVISESIGE